jgi:hypothetical protein
MIRISLRDIFTSTVHRAWVEPDDSGQEDRPKSEVQLDRLRLVAREANAAGHRRFRRVAQANPIAANQPWRER